MGNTARLLTWALSRALYLTASPMTGATRAIPRARCGIMRAVHFPLDGKQELKSHGRWL